MFWRKKKTSSKGDHWDSPEGAALRAHMAAPNPALAAELERVLDRDNADEADAEDFLPTFLHAHKVTANDAARIRMMAGTSFSKSETVTLPSGNTVTGAEMRIWLEANA